MHRREKNRKHRDDMVYEIEKKAEYKTSRDRFTHKKLLYTHNIIEVLCNAFCHSSLHMHKYFITLLGHFFHPIDGTCREI